ncbi:extracellular solute-binding protein [Enterococcus sp. 10A9_DIV0425]|uniref:Extracellular solute-binding protein n=1 Tax=Candidatus Enterococcus wittei TaxID=1987383 RepID=A0A2C9XNW9_9ENTE|nr:transporter substrate-binding domain-containing protein [Enterococcus sp. 10A9_DIV0425]OTP11851.1 extracellular solute-binding protein [Enterococcus sp. 10A9_DIV0425]THE10544.1 transporter substrate-binding domain-containing protein [Enterococcus hirae]
MKKKLMALFMVGFIVLLTSCGKAQAEQADKSWEKVQKNKEMVVATSGTLFPASYYNDENQLVGYDVDIAKEIADRLGVAISFKEYNVDGQITAVSKQQADFAANDFSTTKEREKKFKLSVPIKYSFDSMIVRKSDDSGIQSLEDLDGKKAAGEPNTSYMRLAEEYGATPVTYDNATNDQYLTDVANGRTDVILNDYYLQKMSLAALPDIPVKILEDVYFNENHSGFLFKKENKELRNKVNEVLKEMQEDGTLAKISESYFQTDVSVKPKEKIMETVKD